MTDEVLIERFLKGDIGAFNTLVCRWEKPIFNFIYRNVGNEEVARDICQTVFIRTFKKLTKLKDRKKFSPWIYRIALNLCRDEFKRNHRIVYIEDLSKNEKFSHTISEMPAHRSKTPEDYCHDQIVGDILKRALLTLPEDQRTVVVMKQYQGLKLTEIADILKLSVNTVKSRLYYGLRALRKFLEDSEISKEVLLDEMR